MAKKDNIEDAEVLERNVGGEEAAAAEANAAEKKDEQPDTGEEKKPDKKAESKKTASKKTVPTPEQSGGENVTDGLNFDWGDNDDFISQVTATPTKESTSEGANPHLETSSDEPTAAEKKAYLEGEFDVEEEGLSEEDLFITAELVVEMLDSFNSIGVGAFAKEPSSQFELTDTKKKTLSGLLAKVFYKYQAKLGPVAALVIAALLYFGMSWKMGYDIRKEKQKTAAEEALEAKKEKQRKKKEAFRNKILAAVDLETITLKEIGKRMNLDTGKLKGHVVTLCEQGLLFADHSKPIIHYRQAA